MFYNDNCVGISVLEGKFEMKPFFSIIIPVYNVVPYLRECLDSVLNQTCGDWEAICVDDGSTDGSAMVLDEYAQKDTRVKVFHQANCGVSAARNNGLRHVSAGFVMFLDADDVLREDALSKICSYIDGNEDCQVFCFSLIRFEEMATIDWKRTISCHVSKMDIASAINDISLFWFFSAKAYRKEVLPREGFKPYSRGEDLVFLNECIGNAKKAVSFDETLYAYRIRKGSATASEASPQSIIQRLTDMSQSIPDMVVSWEKHGKKIPLKMGWYLARLVFKDYILDLLKLHSKDRVCLWQRWYRMLNVLCKHKKYFPTTDKIQLFAASAFRVRIIAIALMLANVAALKIVNLLYRKVNN